MASVNDVAVRLQLRNAKTFQRDASGASRSIDKLGRSTSLAARRAKALDAANTRINRGFAAIGAVARTGAVLGIGAVATEAVRATKGWADHLAVTRRTQAVIKSTGSAANVTAAHVGHLTDAIEAQTGVDGDLAQSGANLLLTFTNIRNGVGKNNKIFDQATGTVVNMSKALGQDTKSSAIQLGKALNDPVKGITALQRVGVSFDDTQKKQIANLVKSGKTMQAQRIILRELNKEFPKVKATPFERLQVAVRALEDSIGKALLPIFNKGVRALTKFINQMNNGTGAGGQFVSTMKDIGQFLSTKVIPAFKSIAGWVVNLVHGFKEGHAGAVLLVAAFAGIATGVAAFAALVKIIRIATAVQAAFDVVMDANPIGLVVIAIAALVAAMVVIVTKVRAVRHAFVAAFNWIKHNWPLLAAILLGPVAVATVLVIKHWRSIKNAASATVKWVRAKFESFIGFFSRLPKRMAHAVRGMFNGIKHAFKSAINWVIQKWNGLEFHIGGQKVFGHKLPSVTIGTPNIPELAGGGTVTTSGMALVGERGPELLQLPRAASVIPLGAVGAGGLELVAPVVINIDGRELARANARFRANKTARTVGRT